MELIIHCSKCKTELLALDIYCPNCGYPENADDKEKGRYERKIEIKKEDRLEAHKKIKNVKFVLYFIIAVNLILAVFYFNNANTIAEGISSIIAAAIFIACLLWVKKQPLMGILAAFIFWLVLQLSVILIDPLLLFNGIILKIIFIGIFISGISSARQYNKLNEQLLEMNPEQ